MPALIDHDKSARSTATAASIAVILVLEIHCAGMLCGRYYSGLQPTECREQRMRNAVLAIGLMTLAAVARADQLDTAPAYSPARGGGNVSCGEFVAAKTSNNQMELAGVVQWVWGFLAAYNMRGNFGTKWTRVTVLAPPDNDTVILFLQKHCEAHPLYNVFDGAMTLIRESGGKVLWR